MRNISDSRALFLYDCQSDDAVLSGGSWVAGLPLSNLQNQYLERIARSTNANAASTRINIALKRAVDIAAVYLGWTSLSNFAQARLRLWSSASFTGTPLFDTGWKADVIPADDDPDRSPSLFLILDESASGQYVSVEIDDHLNPLGYVDIGRLIIGRYVKPSFNYSYDGNALNFVSRAIVASTLSGDEKVWDRVEPRTFSMGYQYLPEEEVYTDFYRMLRTVKRGGEVVVIPRPDAGALELQRRSFLGRAVNRDPIVQAVVNRGHASLEIRETMGLAPIFVGFGAIVAMPVDAMRAANFAPSVKGSTIVSLPLDSAVARDFEPILAIGVRIQVPLDTAIALDMAPEIGVGALVSMPLDEVEVENFAPDITIAVTVNIPVDMVDALEFAPAIFCGAVIELQANEAFARDFAPEIGQTIVVAVPVDAVVADDFIPAVGGGVVVMLPPDASEADDFDPQVGVGGIVVPPADAMLAAEYLAMVRGFNTGFSTGFGGGGH